jgi:hypothetical protein
MPNYELLHQVAKELADLTEHPNPHVAKWRELVLNRWKLIAESWDAPEERAEADPRFEPKLVLHYLEVAERRDADLSTQINRIEAKVDALTKQLMVLLAAPPLLLREIQRKETGQPTRIHPYDPEGGCWCGLPESHPVHDCGVVPGQAPAQQKETEPTPAPTAARPCTGK